MKAILVWLVAASVVALVPHPVAKIAIILAAAFFYMWIARRRATVHHALAVGATWLVLAIVVELATAAHLHHGWFELLGTPTHPAVRILMLISWVAAPALFARESAADAAHRPAERG